MANYNMCEALYALSGGKITPHKKPLAMPLLITLAGVAMFVINGWVLAEADLPNLKSALVLFGATFAMVGGAILIARMAGKSTIPYNKGDGCFLKREEIKLDKEKKKIAIELVRNGDFASLRQISSSNISAIVVEIYFSPKGGFTAAQVFEYIDLELQPISELKVVE